jgi:hypothetical protein
MSHTLVARGKTTAARIKASAIVCGTIATQRNGIKSVGTRCDDQLTLGSIIACISSRQHKQQSLLT